MNDKEVEIIEFDDDSKKVETIKNEIYSSFKEKLPEPSNTNSSKETLFDVPKKEEKKLNKKKTPKEKKEKKKKKIKDENDLQNNNKNKFKLSGQNIFCIISILFIIGCFIFYGTRLVKYYKIYNPKPIKGEEITLLGQYLKGNSSIVTEGDGLYKNTSVYVYRGVNNDNYIKIGGLLYRIIKIYDDGSMDLITDKIVNTLMWNKTKTNYVSSDINKYLNEYFIKYINKDLLVNTTICEDEVLDISNVTCDLINNDNYIRLLSTTEFINSKTDDGSYINEENDLWTYNRSDSGTWIINSLNVSNASFDKFYGIKPVVKLKNSVTRIGGTGTKENPYIIEKKDNKLHVGDYISLSGDRWIIYDIDKDNLKLVSNKKLTKKYSFDIKDNIFNINNEGSLANYLNNDYYNNLIYKDQLISVKWYNGEYNKSFEELKKDSVSSKVGLLNTLDLKLLDTESPYYLITPSIKGEVYMYNNDLISSKVNMSRDVYPTIAIKNKKIESGKGTEKSPYILGE